MEPEKPIVKILLPWNNTGRDVGRKVTESATVTRPSSRDLKLPLDVTGSGELGRGRRDQEFGR